MFRLLAVLAAATLTSPGAWAEPAPKPLRVVKPQPEIPKAPAPAKPSADDAAFAEAERALKAFESARLPETKGLTMAEWQTALQTSMAELTRQLGAVHAQYTRLAASGSHRYAVPVLVRTGEIMEKFAAEVDGLRVHPDLPPEPRATMAKSMHQVAEMLRFNARNAYVQAVELAEQTRFKGEWLDFAKAALDRLPSTLKQP